MSYVCTRDASDDPHAHFDLSRAQRLNKKSARRGPDVASRSSAGLNVALEETYNLGIQLGIGTNNGMGRTVLIRIDGYRNFVPNC